VVIEARSRPLKLLVCHKWQTPAKVGTCIRLEDSGSVDNTIRIWDAETGASAGNPFGGQHIVSGSNSNLCWSHFHINNLSLLAHSMLIFIHSLIHRVGSQTQTAAYSIGYP